MSTLMKLALGMMSQLRPKPAQGDASPKITLPSPNWRPMVVHNSRGHPEINVV